MDIRREDTEEHKGKTYVDLNNLDGTIPSKLPLQSRLGVVYHRENKNNHLLGSKNRPGVPVVGGAGSRWRGTREGPNEFEEDLHIGILHHKGEGSFAKGVSWGEVDVNKPSEVVRI